MRSPDAEKRLIRRAFETASAHYDEAAVLQAEVRQRMLTRLDLVNLTPACILDAGAGTGGASLALAKRFRKSRVICLDMATGMLREARRHQSFFRKLDLICGDTTRLPLKEASVDMIFCNLVLPWCLEPETVFREFARILKPRGLVTLSTFGPDTLKELRQAFAAVDDGVHVNMFPDMHDVGDAMIRAGLSEPVMDVERFTLTYGDVTALMRDLKAVGESTVIGRDPPPGLMGRGRLEKLIESYETFRRDGRLPATYEVVYGHGWGGVRPRGVPEQQRVARIPLSSIGRREHND